LAIASGFILQDLIADMQFEQIEKAIENTNLTEEQKDERLSGAYDRVYSKTGISAIFTYVSMAISWPIRIAFWALFAMLTANLFLGGGGKYGQVFTISAFAYLPSVVEYIIKTPIQYMTDNIMIFTSLGVLGIGEQGEFFNSFLAGIDVFAFWRVFLVAVAVGILYNKSTKTALTSMVGLWIFGLVIFAGIGSAAMSIFG
ncbi:MAG: YIP1 family protein, partial [Candidatus Marinimicrobia bacterium]|nr:YIP1 family protein [Candidatus Neomarinimicrobiota bacterium]